MKKYDTVLRRNFDRECLVMYIFTICEIAISIYAIIFNEYVSLRKKSRTATFLSYCKSCFSYKIDCTFSIGYIIC